MSLLMEKPVEQDDDDFEVTADDCQRLAEQSTELSARRKELVAIQDETESELRDLRARVALGKASAGDEMRRETLLERSNQQAGELRELTRLIRLTDKGLSRAETLRKHAAEHAAIQRAAMVSTRAKERLQDAQEAVLLASATYCAVWGLSERAKPYFASRRERATHGIDPRELEALVTTMMTDLERELADG